MTEITLFQDLIGKLDLQLPWLLPALETFEQIAPTSFRLAICVPLMAWFVLLRQRSAEDAANRMRHLALL